MKSERNILIAFILNLAFSVFEFIGGILTGSTAIASDAVHDAGDAASIGVSYFLEKKSKRQPDEKYTYGYAGYSAAGSFITTLVLLAGAFIMIYNAAGKIISPTEIDYDGMIIFAVFGACVNFAAALFTREGGSLNQRAVNLHMLEDVLGWICVLAGAVVMHFTDFALLDPIMSIGVSAFIIINAVKNLKETACIFLEKAPRGIDVAEIREHIGALSGVLDVHHVHIWSIDGQRHCATMHIVVDGEPSAIKENIRRELNKHGIFHVTIETEADTEACAEKLCRPELHASDGHSRHHGHSHRH